MQGTKKSESSRGVPDAESKRHSLPAEKEIGSEATSAETLEEIERNELLPETPPIASTPSPDGMLNESGTEQDRDPAGPL